MKIAIIDDEDNCRILIRKHLQIHINNTVDIFEANSVSSGLNLIKTHEPNIVFLDIQMNDGTGFDLLNKIEQLNFKLIFTTAFDNYAIKAFNYAAVHYLLKPIDFSELSNAYDRAFNETNWIDNTRNLLVNYDSGEFNQLSLKTENDFHTVQLSEIEYIGAEGSYCSFAIKGKKPILISKPLKEYAQLLPESDFMRVHKSYLVNINWVQTFHYRSSELVLKSNVKIPVSRRNKKEIMAILVQKNMGKIAKNK
ncbi:MAG: two-component system LytT family response regulator [Crocinitomix sp.]|jgi:two-component system LytT family response regulator